MTRLSALIGQPTISLDDAEQRGRVDGVEIEPGRVTALRTRDGAIDVTAIRTFEGDAVTYDGRARPSDDDAASPIGRRVLTVDGDELGKLADLDLADDGTITSVLLDDGRGLDGTALQVVGSYAVIVDQAPDDAPPSAALPPPPPPD